jgi:RNA polymerase sigma factor (sigma-70 family)
VAASDDVLLTRARNDPDAFGLFYRRHVDHMIRFAARRTTSPHEVADLVADVFVAAIESLHVFDPARGSAMAWLYGIANNVAANRWRAGRSHLRTTRRLAGRRLLDDDDIARLDERIAAEAHRRELLAALRDLPARQRDVLILVHVDGLEPAEAARALGIRPPAARMRLTRARRRVRERLAHADERSRLEGAVVRSREAST